MDGAQCDRPALGVGSGRGGLGGDAQLAGREDVELIGGVAVTEDAASCNTCVFVPHQLSLLLLATGLAFFDCLDAGYVFYFTDASVDVLQLARTL